MHRKDRVSNFHGGGVAAYVPNHLKVNRRFDFESDNIDILWLEIKLRRKRLLLGIVYRPPTDIEFFAHFLNIHCLETNKTCMLIGDFNCNTLAPNSKPTKLLFNIAAEYQQQQLITTPTS